MTHQRRRGILADIYPSKTVTDTRGNDHRAVDLEAEPHRIKVWVFPQRSAKAEVPGQQQINVVRIGTAADLSGVDLYSRVHMRGTWWDVVTPPAYRHGTRGTRHWSIDIRERPSG